MIMYPLKRNRLIRRKTEYIILAPIRDTVEDGAIDPDILSNNSMFTWGMWQDYYMIYKKKKSLPCHYFVEKVDTDCVVYKGLNDFQPSYFIEDLVSSSVLDRNYMNSILVLYGDDCSRYPFDKRMAEHMADKVITPLLRQYNLDFTHVKMIDDCLKPDWEENLKFSNIQYKIKPQRYFDFQVIKTYIDKFNKK